MTSKGIVAELESLRNESQRLVAAGPTHHAVAREYLAHVPLWEIAHQLAILNERDAGAESRYAAAIAACRAVVEANDHGMRAEEGRRAVELCRAVVADEDRNQRSERRG